MKMENQIDMPKKLKAKNSYFILTLVILISCLVIYADFIFGNKFFMFEDIGSDAKPQFYGSNVLFCKWAS